MYRIVFIACLLVLNSCTNLLFVPVKRLPVTPDVADILYDDIYVTTNDGLKLHGWKMHGKNEKKGSILFFHGNGDNVSTQLPNTYWMIDYGYDVYVIDYRGYGLSQGDVDLDATISDMEASIGTVIRQLESDQQLVVMGHSLGGSMAVYVVAKSQYRDRLAALVTIESFSDYRQIAQEAMNNSWLLWAFQWPLSYTIDNTYRPLDYIAEVAPVPVLILHSESDTLVSLEHAEALFAAAHEPKSFQLIDSDHNNIFVDERNRQLLLDYLQQFVP